MEPEPDPMNVLIAGALSGLLARERGVTDSHVLDGIAEKAIIVAIMAAEKMVSARMRGEMAAIESATELIRRHQEAQ